MPQEYLEQGLTVEDLLQQIELPETVEVTQTQDLGGGNWLIGYRWSTIDTFGDELTKNPDGSYTLNFTNIQFFSQLIIHLEGKIIQTNGQKKNANTVVFSGIPEGTVTFVLGSGAPPSPPPTTTPPTGTLPPTTQPPT
ncbi:MAG: hypothetical protein QHH21_07880, partial [Caldisericota bacterium]|nr:hypothetical protein [Caldisericota bacterium]